jgi:hypothetical protein
MSWSEQARQGFALAATVADDPGAELAAEGLVISSADDLCRVARELSRLGPEERRQRVRSIAGLLNPCLPGTVELLPRALALLAAEVDAETGRRWIRESPPPRPGYEPEPGLRALIRLVAERTGSGRPGASGQDGSGAG